MAYGYGRRSRLSLADTLAFVSLAFAVFGLLAVSLLLLRVVSPMTGVIAFPAEILAIVIGHIARWCGGLRMALAGMWTGYGFFALLILTIIVVWPRS